MAVWRIRTVYADLLLIVAVWSTLLLTLLILQALGLDFGFDIWPTGEFRNWIDLFQEGGGAVRTANLFWELDHRNALSPWWYAAARPLISTTAAAPLILHLLAGLFVGLAAYLLLLELTYSRPFALSVGVLSALFVVNVHIDDVIWNFVGALGCSLMSIYLFALFYKDRRKTSYLSASYIMWYVAFATYSLQIGAIGGIFLVSLRSWGKEKAFFNAFYLAVIDILPYGALLAAYLLFWITASPANPLTANNLQFSLEALARSIAFGVWNDHYRAFVKWLVLNGPILLGFVFVSIATVILILLRTVRQDAFARPTMNSLGFSLLVATFLVAPTVGLEAMSDVWVPGTRWPMLMQFWTPFVFCVLFFAVTSAIPDRFWWPVWRNVSAAAAAFVILLVLGFNRIQVTNSQQERAFFAELKSTMIEDRAAGVKFPRRYVVYLAEPPTFRLVAGRLADVYARTILGHDVTFEFVMFLPEPMRNTVFIWKEGRLSRTAMAGEKPASSVQPKQR